MQFCRHVWKYLLITSRKRDTSSGLKFWCNVMEYVNIHYPDLLPFLNSIFHLMLEFSV